MSLVAPCCDDVFVSSNVEIMCDHYLAVATSVISIDLFFNSKVNNMIKKSDKSEV